MGVFCACWVPFFVTNLLYGLCRRVGRVQHSSRAFVMSFSVVLEGTVGTVGVLGRYWHVVAVICSYWHTD